MRFNIKIMIALGLTLLVTNTINASAWYKRMVIGGPTYYIVDVRVDYWGCSIWCDGYGPNNCPYGAIKEDSVTHLMVDEPYTQAAVDYALDQINTYSNLNGSHTMSGTFKYVVWDFTSDTTSITVSGPNDPLPN